MQHFPQYSLLKNGRFKTVFILSVFKNFIEMIQLIIKVIIFNPFGPGNLLIGQVF